MCTINLHIMFFCISFAAYIAEIRKKERLIGHLILILTVSVSPYL